MANDRRKSEASGRSAEVIALWALRLKGWRLLAQRYKTHVGEVDLIMRRGEVTAFIEVKARATALAAAESVGMSQQTRIARAASLYLASRPGLARRGSRFDIVAIAPRSLPVHHRDAWRPDF